MRISASGWTVVVISIAMTLVLVPETPDLVGDLRGSSFPDALVAAISLTGVLLAGWVVIVAALTVGGASAGLVAALTPAALRGLLLAGAAGSLTLNPAAAERAPESVPDQHRVHGLPLPDRPDTSSTEATEARTPTRTEAAQPPATRTVRPGDTLWAIAAESVPGASAARIAAETARWHDANRDVIGDDPDLIFPDHVLVPPTGKDLP